MPLITLILVLALIGFILWLVTTYIPMPEPWGKIIVAVAVVAVILWLLQSFGGVGPVLR